MKIIASLFLLITSLNADAYQCTTDALGKIHCFDERGGFTCVTDAAGVTRCS